MDIKLRKASHADIPLIAKLADTIWHQHYPSIISLEQISYMLNLMYSSTSLESQMDQKQHEFYIIEQDGAIGFLAIERKGPDDLFLHKFYIDQQVAGKGAGTLAFRELQQTLKAKQVRLTVNRQNFKSINFYFKNGFKIESVADFDIGQGYVMNDFVMIWQARK